MPRSPWKKVEQFFFALAFLLSTSKVGQEQIFLVSTMPKAPSMKLRTSKHGQDLFFCTPPPTFNAKNRRLNNKNFSNFVHGDLCMVHNNFFAFSLLLLASKVEGWKQKKLPWPHFEFLSFVLRVLGMVKIKFFGLSLLFLAPKVGGWKQKKLPQPHFEFLSFVLRVLSMSEIFLALHLPLLVPKVGGQAQKKMISTMFRTPSTNLRNSKCG